MPLTSKSRRGEKTVGSCSKASSAPTRSTPLAEDLREIFPSAEDLHADPEGVTERWKGHPKEPEEVFVWPDEGPGFRPAQQRWAAIFPFPGTGALNRMCVHPSIVDFAERALGSTDIRLYQAQASAKYAGMTNYEQPMHIDRNHSWLPAGSESPWWNLEGFLYLTDVTEDDNPTRLVSVRDTGHVDNPYGRRHAQRWTPASTRPSGPPRGSGVRTSPTGPTVSTGAPPSAPAPEPVSWPPSPSSTQASNGSATTPSRTVRPASSGRPSWRARRRASWRSSAGPPPGHPVWTKRLLDQTQQRYPALDLGPWRAAVGAPAR